MGNACYFRDENGVLWVATSKTNEQTGEVTTTTELVLDDPDAPK